MSRLERKIYASWPLYVLNQASFPLRQLIPQPVIARIPGFKTNKQVRTEIVLSLARGRLLDIGCGDNQLVSSYKGPGTGADVHPWPGVDCLVEDTSRLPFPDASFDTITFVACLNHIPNRQDVLLEAKRLLARDGQIIITNLPPGLSRFWHWWAFWDPDQHDRGMGEGETWGFTKQEMRDLLAQAGLKVALHETFNWGLLDLFVAQKSGLPEASQTD